MADLIDRDALWNDLRIECPESDVCNKCSPCIECIVNRQPAVNRWIPCSERMPENGQNCIVCTADKRIRLAVWLGDYDEWGVWQISKKLYRTINVPAWMPMPDAYGPSTTERISGE